MTDGKKRERPLYLDMDFGEALERFAQTDPKEVAESIQRAKKKKPPGAKAPDDRSPPSGKKGKVT